MRVRTRFYKARVCISCRTRSTINVYAFEKKLYAFAKNAHAFYTSVPLKLHLICTVCFGSLSCINLCPCGYIELINGRRFLLRISTYVSAFIVPSKIHILVLPCQLIPPHTRNFMGCFGRGLFLGFAPFFQQQNLSCDSSWMVDSSSFRRHERAHSYLFNLFCSRIIWQYAAPQYFQSQFMSIVENTAF